MILRYIQLSLVGVVALFFSLVAFDNILESTSNFPAVQHVLSMDTTFRVPLLMQRAITNPSIQLGFYYTIIAWQLLTALLCWIGSLKLLFQVHASNAQFKRSKSTAYLGLFLGLLLYLLGFIVIGGEWFSMWQSSAWNAQPTAGLFSSMILNSQKIRHQDFFLLKN